VKRVTGLCGVGTQGEHRVAGRGCTLQDGWKNLETDEGSGKENRRQERKSGEKRSGSSGATPFEWGSSQPSEQKRSRWKNGKSKSRGKVGGKPVERSKGVGGSYVNGYLCA